MSHGDVTRLLDQCQAGDRDAFDALLAAVYGELRGLARSHLRRERAEHTLSATSLVHEAYLKLVAHRDRSWHSRAHFFGAASHAMRRILVDYARGRAADKRRAERVSLTAVEDTLADSPSLQEVLLVDDALDRLAAVRTRLARVVECRYFTGLTIPETAEALGVSHATVSDDWRFARAWLRQALSGTAPQERA